MSESPRLTRCVVLAASALDRRALSLLDGPAHGIQFVAICASLSATRDHLRRDEPDLVALDEQAGSPDEILALADFATAHQVRVSIYRGELTAEATVEKVLAFLAPARPGSGEFSVAVPPATPTEDPARTNSAARLPRVPPAVVVVGSSTGGPEALGELIPRLPANFRPPILIAQHMPPAFTTILASRLEERAQLTIHEAEDGQPLESGHVFIAPGDYHMGVSDEGLLVRLHQGPPENSCRPAVDVLFRSVAKVYRERALGVILTGMGRDGFEGARHLRDRGADVFVQDESSSVVWGMPGFVARAGLASRVGSLPELAEWLLERTRMPGRLVLEEGL